MTERPLTEADLEKAQDGLRVIRRHVDAAERVLRLLPTLPDGVDIDSLQVWIGTRDQWRTMLAEVKRPLREALECVNAGMDHADDCWMATPGPAECNCPMKGVREALGLTPETRGLSDCKRAKEVLG